MNTYSELRLRAFLATKRWFNRYGHGYPKAVFHSSTACEILNRKMNNAKSKEAFRRLQAMWEWCAHD